MMRRSSLLPVVIFFVLPAALAFGADPSAESSSDKGRELFEKQIQPVLVKTCYECHSKGVDSIAGGLELDSPTGMMRGGESGAVIIPHDPEKSLLIRMLRQEADVSPMPPDGKLTSQQIAAFVEWIRLGAPDSRKENGPTAREQRFAEGSRHWSLQPPRSASAPPVKHMDWPRGNIDQFILARLEAEGLQPVADAGRRTLLRRVYFDLIGLPPTPQEIEQFLADTSAEAFPRVIDRLLNSPLFGERWGRHWLDIVRYAESSGLEFNFTYPHAWPYRDYVIDAFNQDKPYDLFLREQIAGDLLPRDERDSAEEIEDRLIAPSMLALGIKRHNSGGLDFQMDMVDDQIDTVFRSTLGLTVACARCHDHKFDPIPTKDYYALAGIFLSTEPLYGTIKQKYSNNPTDLLPLGPKGAAMHQAAEEHEKVIAEADKQLKAKQDEHKKAIAAEKQAAAKKADAEKLVKLPAVDPKAEPKPEAADALKKATADLNTAKQQSEKLKAEVGTLEKKIADLKKLAPPRPQYSMSARDRAKPADTKIAIRGNYRDRGEIAPRGFLSAVEVAHIPDINPQHSGRLELAQWIASRDNPLAARVMVNRIWHHLFGRGLVATVDNFGLLGKEPTHPELLDTLAVQFMNDGWSVKKMVRALVLTRTYQLSCQQSPAHLKADPTNLLLWRASPRRLEAEAIRDAMLAVSGQLNCDRPNGSTVTLLGDQLVRGIPLEKIQPPSNHRSVYLPIVRDYVPEIFDLFDFPSPSLVTGNRSVTNVPAQALYLRNSNFVAEQARHAAARLLADPSATTDEQRADLAARWTLAHPLTPEQRAGALQLVHQIEKTQPDEKKDRTTAWAALFQTLFTTAEFRYLVDIR